MKILLSLIFILISTYAISAGTDSGGSSSSGGGSSSSSSNSSNSSSGSKFSHNTIDVNVEFHRAKKFIYKNQFEKGIKTLKSIENAKPFGYSKADLYNYLGFASRKLPQPNYVDAEKYYLKALSFDSKHIGALEYLGELYVETGRLDMAKSMLSELLTLAGENSEEYKSLEKLID